MLFDLHLDSCWMANWLEFNGQFKKSMRNGCFIEISWACPCKTQVWLVCTLRKKKIKFEQGSGLQQGGYRIGAVSTGRGVCPLMYNYKLEKVSSNLQDFTLFVIYCRQYALYQKSDFLYSQKWNREALFPIPTSCICERSWEYITRSHIHECGHWETEHYNSCFGNNEAGPQSSNSGICKSEPDISNGFWPTLHLQCIL